MMYSEWLQPGPDIPVRQGDLLLSRDPKSGRVLMTCLVITADCDISKGKSGSEWACLRVLSLQDYIRTVWGESKLLRTMNREVGNIQTQLNKWNARRQGSPSTLTQDGVLHWVRNEEPAAICARLELPPQDAARVTTSLTTFRSALTALEKDTTGHALGKLVAFQAAMQNEQSMDCLRKLVAQAQGEPLPEDVFLVPVLPQVEEYPAVIMLRDLLGIPIKDVCYRASDAVSEAQYLRIGRLEPTLKYAVSQAFGALYSRIGLHPTFEEHCRNAIASIPTLGWE